MLACVVCAGVVGVRVVVDAAAACVVVEAAGVIAVWLAAVVVADVDAAGCAIATPPANISAAPAATSKRTFIWISQSAAAVHRAVLAALIAGPPPGPMTGGLQICEFGGAS